jgi:hypothetical protein
LNLLGIAGADAEVGRLGVDGVLEPGVDGGDGDAAEEGLRSVEPGAGQLAEVKGLLALGVDDEEVFSTERAVRVALPKKVKRAVASERAIGEPPGRWSCSSSSPAT